MLYKNPENYALRIFCKLISYDAVNAYKGMRGRAGASQNHAI